jgi:hypothetical protein
MAVAGKPQVAWMERAARRGSSGGGGGAAAAAPPAQPPAALSGVGAAECNRLTDGTCMLFQCATWRRATCVASKCTCGAGSCAQWSGVKGGFACVSMRHGHGAAAAAAAGSGAGALGGDMVRAASFGARACPVGCVSWFDGCNDCACAGPGAVGACSFNPDCAVARRAHCKRYRGSDSSGGVAITNAMGAGSGGGSASDPLLR